MKRFDVGSRVHEPTYGHGSVISVEDAFTRIQFDDNTARKFLTSLAKIKPSSRFAYDGACLIWPHLDQF